MLFPEVTAFLSELTGLDPASIGLSSVEQTVRARIRRSGCAGEQAYLALLRKSPSERRELIREISVPETWFFRDGEVFRYLSGLLGAGWKERRPLRVLCVPCSTGEEAYSIAITLAEAGVGPSGARIVAIDLCPEFIERARCGVFGGNSFRSGEGGGAALEKYFETIPEGFRVVRRIREYIEWRTGNIIDAFFLPGEGPFDAIFSRNLFIYLRASMREQAMRSIKRLLASDGLLFMGSCETPGASGFRPVNHPGAFAFRRDCSDDTAVCAIPAPPPPAPASMPGAFTSPAPAEKPVTGPAGKALELRDLKREASRLAERGMFTDAKEALKKCLRLDPADAGTYLLFGFVDEGMGDDISAEKHFMKALYLDDSCTEALVRLCSLARKHGKNGVAESCERRLQNLRRRSGGR